MATVGKEISKPTTEMAAVEAEQSGPGHGHVMHKNRLQEYAQRSGLPVPSYSTINEGEPHAPKFRATILVDGLKFTSPYTFAHRKEAEQDVAKHALEIISVKFKNEGSFNIHKDPVFCKLILNEYGAKVKKDKPTYTTTQQDNILPIFTTIATFDGKSYVGIAGRSKKEAEQNAACVVIDSFLANSDTVSEMAQIIKAKSRLYATVNDRANVSNFVLKSETENTDADSIIKGTELTAVATNDSLPTGSTNWVPYTSPWAGISQSNPVNCQIPALSLPMVILDSQAIIPKNKKKRLKKKKISQSKRRRADEQSLVVISRSIRDQVLLIILFLLMLPWGIHRRRTSGSFYDYLRCA